MQIFFKRLFPDVSIPEYKTRGSVAFDIEILHGKIIEPEETHFFSTGLIISVPEGYMLMLANRSSNAKKQLTLANGIGVIDQDYCGPEDELHLAIKNVGKIAYEVKKGERLAQGIILPVERVQFIEHEIEGRKNRGGFGTTG